ncbi:unknown [Firmicutes bacterium CAG:313]|nr:unknown [Firmicutes bacterium CAG:313]
MSSYIFLNTFSQLNSIGLLYINLNNFLLSFIKLRYGDKYLGVIKTNSSFLLLTFQFPLKLSFTGPNEL